MTVEEFFQANADHVAYQIRVLFDEFQDEQWDSRLVPGAMSPRETLVHLSDCYQCASQRIRGEKPNWGSFQTAESDPVRIKEVMLEMRNRAIQEALGAGNHELLAEIFAYIQEHDSYHVGQLCLLKLRQDPNWDPYSIYPR
ncbi:MAG: DinB family protein [Fimbriimonadaceae bacterium]|nr:DinB family protein [Fimbriimonadaceae bacterium]QYK59667.1 MAG: DinB family protein [Fimbriimonadaceae bacterium]